MPMNRRNLLKAAAITAPALILRPSLARSVETASLIARLAALEQQHGGRLGVSMLDLGSGRRVAHRSSERFLMCSTFKLLAVAAVLKRVDTGAEQLDRRIVFGQDAVLSYAPVTRQHVGGAGMKVEELCQAAIMVSDNTAANLLLASMGGPAAVTAFARSLGDAVTRLDRIEPMLNVGHPGDLRDTTTPDAMLASMHHIVLGRALSVTSRARITGWLRACATGTEQLRADLPSGWIAGDKTGSGAQNETNDIATLWPPARQPILVTAYYAGSAADDAGRHAVLAEVGRIAASL